MSPAFITCIASVLAEEAGYKCDSADAGNWSSGELGVGALIGTSRGISAPVLCAWRKAPVSAADMRALTKEEAEAIYEGHYWVAIRGDALPLVLAFVTLDAAVNSGVRLAVEWLQGALGVPTDGKPGAMTLHAADACADVAGVVRSYGMRRLAFLRERRAWGRFGDGWTARVKRVQGAALALIDSSNAA